MPDATGSFELDPRLEADSALVTRLPLCQLRRMNERQFPWLLLVPERAGIEELHQLEPAELQQLWAEVTAVSERLQQHCGADKMNVAALGNIVPQLHVHVVARFGNDPAWPAPIWGRFEASPFSPEELVSECSRLLSAMADLSIYVK